MRPAIKPVPKPCIMPTRALPKSRRDLGDLLLDKSAKALPIWFVAEPQAARALFAYFRKEFGP
jgi:hypothetical protein